MHLQIVDIEFVGAFWTCAHTKRTYKMNLQMWQPGREQAKKIYQSFLEP
jgi:hypothetical protein